MNIFRMVERSSGENLSSSVLRYLLLRSMPIREAFLEFISEKSPIGPIYSESDFGVYLEISTKDEELGKGRRGSRGQILTYNI